MAQRVNRKLKDELKSSWFIPLRLTIFLLLFGALVLSERTSPGAFKPFLFYSLATLLFLFLIGVNIKRLRPGFLSAVVFIQILFELLTEGSIISGSEQLTSQYSVLFLLTIVSASLVYRLAWTLVVATLASGIYTVNVILYKFLNGSDIFNLQHISQVYHSADDIFYAVFLHICTFYLVAFISGFLAEKLQVKEGELTSASEKLIRARLDTDTILRNLHSGLISIDNMGEIIYFNHSAEAILDMKEKDVRGKSVFEVFGRRMPEFGEKMLSVLKLSKPSIRTELEITNREGKTIPLGLTTSILGDERAGIRGVIAVFQDLTAAKKMEQALIEADRLAAVGELAAGIAHEIRNPLASISGSVEVLKGELSVSGDNEKLMDLIVWESERLSRILSDFLYYARVKPTKLSKVELVSTVDETIELFNNSSHRPSISSVSLKTDYTTMYVVADKDQVKQILINLLANAVDAINSQKGKIEVAIVSPDPALDVHETEWVCLKVIDNGQGFSTEDKTRVFEPFYSRKEGGTGLGLAIVKRCVDNMGARISVETSPGIGTTFYILFRKYLLPLDSVGAVTVGTETCKS